MNARLPNLTLPCPACGRAIEIPAAAQGCDGAAIRCAHCMAESVLQRERIGHGDHIRWELIEAGDDDEP